ncbi:dienelactone hydrolase family protein [Elioraea sp.]|uniref:dienelactone hydrolase family protein n=1 Tax=Elioraea sp. TaxID=2185103 RepID=UPI00307F5AC4
MTIPQAIIDLYDRYTHGGMDRRTFLDRLSALAGGAPAAAALLPLLRADPTRAAIVPPDDPRLATARFTWAGPDGDLAGYLARPAQGGRFAAVIVIHENRGLNPHIEDVTRRMALEGFLALAPDLLSRDGGTPADEDRARAMIGRLDRDRTLARLASAIPFLAGHPDGNGRVGAIGFCWGGGMVNALAAAAPDLAAGVAYYGRQIPAEQVPAIRAPLLLHYADHDAGINAGIEAYTAALRAHGKTFEVHTYPGTQHAFNNDTSAARYHPEAAALAWQRTVAFLRRHLAG